MNDCLILIDKPLNLTSNYVLQSMKKRLKIKNYRKIVFMKYNRRDG